MAAAQGRDAGKERELIVEAEFHRNKVRDDLTRVRFVNLGFEIHFGGFNILDVI